MSQPTDTSFDINAKTKGSYRRRAEDINRALQHLQVEVLSSEASFLFYYFACEKLAKIIIGITNKEPASKYFDKTYSLHTNILLRCCRKSGLSITEADINWIFLSRCDNDKWNKFVGSSKTSTSISKSAKSARWIRNKLVHDIGPTHADFARDQSHFLVTKMRAFLNLSNHIVRLLESANKDR